MSSTNDQIDPSRDAAPAADVSSRAVALGEAALIALLAVVAYWPAMHGDFLWDDMSHVPRVDLQSTAGLVRIWTEPGATQQYYPLSNSLHWLEHRLWGNETFGYHLVNVLLHAANASLVLAVLRKLQVPGALLAAAIFAFHPVHVESVAWISEQKNTLSALFYLASMWVYLDFDESRKQATYVFAIVLFVLGLLSKTIVATLPGALLVILWWKRGTIAWRDVAPLVPFLVVGAVAGLFTAWIERTQVGAAGADFDLSPVERFLLASRVPWFYAAKLLWPANLVFFYPRWTIDASQGWQWVFPAATLAVLVAFAFLAWRWQVRAPLAGVLFFLITLFPVLGFLNVYPFLFSYVADHFQYLASLGLIVPIAAGLTLGASRLPHALAPAAKTLGAAVVLMLAFLTWRQSSTYADVWTLYRTTLARNPQAWLAHNNLGVELADWQRHDEAIAHYHKALRIRPSAAEVHYNLGNSLAAKNQPEQAIAEYREAIRYFPKYSKAMQNLGVVLADEGKTTEAVELLEQAVELTPNNPDAHDKLGALLLKLGRVQDAAPHFAQALKLDPSHTKALNNMASALLKTGNPYEAIDVALRSVSLDPNYAPAHNNLGAALARVGRFPEAIIHFKEAARLDPNDVASLGNLMAAQAAVGRRDEAIKSGNRALLLAKSAGDAAMATQIQTVLNQLEAMPDEPPSTTPPASPTTE